MFAIPSNLTMRTMKTFQRKLVISIMLTASAILWSRADAFQSVLPLSSAHAQKVALAWPRRSSSNPAEETNEALMQKDELSETLSELDQLQSCIGDAPDKASLESLQENLMSVEAKVLTRISAPLPPVGLSMTEYANALLLYAKLPVRSRIAFCRALRIENPIEAALDFDRIPEIVSRLYTDRAQLTPSLLQTEMKKTANLVFVQKVNSNNNESSQAWSTTANVKSTETSSTTKTTTTSSVRNLSRIFGGRDGNVADDKKGEISDKDRERLQLVEATLARTTRQEGRMATEQDLATLMAALDRETFVVAEKETIPGGFILRGEANSKLSVEDLLEAIDSRLPNDWSCQVSYLNDFTALLRDDLSKPKALLVVKKDLSPEPRLILRGLTSAIGLATAFLFSIGVYGGNQLVMDRLEQKSAEGDLIGFEWFTDKTLEVLLPLLAIQLAHELGHWLIAQRDGLKTTAPTILPAWGLPVLGCLTNLKESPKSFTSLFDYAAIGPVLGMTVSFAFLVSGLELTNAATPETLKYLPALPVDILRSSTLGGSMVDTFLGGGQGFITLQDPKTSVPLHPFAIAGFTGLLSNALSLLPLGSTDGGRISMTIFGRSGQLVLGSVVWVLLLIASFTFERADALIGAWVVYNIVQNDLEIPCRDEVTQVDTIRAVMAFGLWFVAILAIVPMP